MCLPTEGGPETEEKKVDWWHCLKEKLPHWVSAVKQALLVQPPAAAESVFSALSRLFTDHQENAVVDYLQAWCFSSSDKATFLHWGIFRMFYIKHILQHLSNTLENKETNLAMLGLLLMPLMKSLETEMSISFCIMKEAVMCFEVFFFKIKKRII